MMRNRHRYSPPRPANRIRHKTAADVDTAVEVDDAHPNSSDGVVSAADDKQDRPLRSNSPYRAGLLFCCAALVAVAALGAWLGYRDYGNRANQQRHDLFLQAARQAAVNLTSISYKDVDADLQLIADNSTGSFRDDFRQRAPVFAEFVKQIKSVSEGTVSEVGVESEHGDSAQVIVAVTVQSSSAEGVSQQPRHWRMRIGVQKADSTVKVTNVEFVP
ncbi:hypothetical protein ABQF17_06805 [Mycolicibacterium elephantis]|uniref:hypothetical protein n=1 Tax=Mycolicibacterium elephantis TaxID=81858 RepID=UPI000699B3A6|nr:hypothetical protein [Mycolicibacterium elephantis]OBB16480.1 hypothetical protein A5762_02440 [Mycolicibacterium elephantis]OBE94932.1 hypothetical protein A5776_21550 [Mycolicibacterium elephantis]